MSKIVRFEFSWQVTHTGTVSLDFCSCASAGAAENIKMAARDPAAAMIDLNRMRNSLVFPHCRDRRAGRNPRYCVVLRSLRKKLFQCRKEYEFQKPPPLTWIKSSWAAMKRLIGAQQSGAFRGSSEFAIESHFNSCVRGKRNFAGDRRDLARTPLHWS
ncbi:MAG TPA: hypothetical protein PLW68_07640 [Casimicrobiaceae bacterium]|nr:hypothetical protein [Casimicrobiaceae bacterium]